MPLWYIATHEDFVTLMTDTEIYVDGIATMHFQDMNSVLEVVREKLHTQILEVISLCLLNCRIQMDRDMLNI